MSSGTALALEGRVAIVTGGSKGLGLAMAKGFARAGADVVVASRKLQACEQVAAAIEAPGRRALPIACHVGDWGQCDALIERVPRELGRIDILANNAGIAPVAPRLLDVTEALALWWNPRDPSRWASRTAGEVTIRAGDSHRIWRPKSQGCARSRDRAHPRSGPPGVDPSIHPRFSHPKT